MSNKREYEIAFVGLKPGLHEFRYELDDKFFVEKGVVDIENFDNCYVVVTEVGRYQTYFSIKTEWKIPVQQMNLDGVDELENMLFPVPGISKD